MNGKKTQKALQLAEYTFVGGGPANICAISAVLGRGVPASKIRWIDRGGFKVGDFGSILSAGSSVPGNTSVEDYQKVRQAIYQLLPQFAPENAFAIDSLASTTACSLKIAAEPFQHLSDGLRTLVDSIEGSVTNIDEVAEGLRLTVSLSTGGTEIITTKRCILATGAHSKKMSLPDTHSQIIQIDPNIAFIQSHLADYLRANPGIKTVAVIGSSHSAALATMHLLAAGLHVKQFMNKEYRFATPAITPDGVKYIQFDNTGLKGDVASFTKKLLLDLSSSNSRYKAKYERYLGNGRQEVEELLEKHLHGCSHALPAVGYEASSSLLINKRPLSSWVHNNKTTAFAEIKGLFGIGIAFPPEIKAFSGEVEMAVGISKFWHTVNNAVVRQSWENTASAKD